jgi:hypothetical protein
MNILLEILEKSNPLTDASWNIGIKKLEKQNV